jgi:uncharacterized delta-60 repeat protein
VCGRGVRSPLVVMMVSFVFGAAVGVAAAADGDLDPTFGDAGIAVAMFPGGSYANEVTVQADGRIVAAGAAAGASSQGVFAVARFSSDGSLDPSFSGDGMVTTHVRPGGGDEAHAVLVQPNGRIVVAGTDGRSRFALARYLPGGALDESFGGDGVVTTNITPVDDIAYDVLLQADGRIVAVGSAGGWKPEFALVRYRRNGSLDPTFGRDGTVITHFGIWGVPRAAALGSDGRIVAVGTNGRGFALARYRRNGALDPTFGTDGKVGNTVELGWASAIAIQPDGRLVVGGDRDIFSSAIARYRPNGSLDPSFGVDGVWISDVGASEEAIVDLAIQPSERIVAVGRVGPHEGGEGVLWRFVVIRLLPDGSHDASFGIDGMTITGFPEGAFADGAAVQADGDLVVAGGLGEANAEAFVLARYHV